MLFYTSSIPITIRTTSQVKHIEATLDQNNLNPEHIYSLGRAEWEYLENYIESKHLNINDVITLRDDSSFSSWSHMPMFLGRKNETFVSLIEQLEALKTKHPNRSKFRIAINNGFGSSLGDSMIGITAFKHVYPILSQHLGNVEIDVIMGWTHDESVIELYKQVPEFNVFVEKNCTLAELADYQAVFDFYGLLKLPDYGKIPVVDWYMLWMGIDISNISSHNKRNSIHIDIHSGLEIETLLGEFESRTILVNQSASVNLRSIPRNFMNSLVEYLLNEYPTYRFITLQKLDIDNPRVIDFVGKTPNLSLLAALVYKVDAVITPDTYILHLADATNTPCVALYTSVLPRRYPYYPLSSGLLLPNATELPAWNKSKTTTQEWEEIEPLYKSSWDKFNLFEIKCAIDDVILRKSKFNQSLRPYNFNKNDLYELTNGLYHGKGLTKLSLTTHIETAIKSVVDKYLVYGDHVVCIGASYDTLIFDIAYIIGQLGKLYVFEPRRAICQLVCANAIVSQFNNIYAFNVLPYSTSGDLLSIQSLDVKLEYNTISSNNRAVTDKVFTSRIDDCGLEACRMIVINKPVDAIKSLSGSMEIINRFSPILICCIKATELTELIKCFDVISYSYRLIPIDDVGEYLCVVAVVSASK